MVCGLDEVGRGAWAGPLVAAGVVFKNQETKELKELRDSKKLRSDQRRKLYEMILSTASVVEIEIISALQINNRGVGWANQEIFKRLIKRIEAEEYLVDGNLKLKVNGKSNRIKSLVKADNQIPEVMAASIVAKVTRDKLMEELHESYPNFGWRTNVGYGTKHHLRVIQERGMTRHHRGIFVTTALRRIELRSYKGTKVGLK